MPLRYAKERLLSNQPSFVTKSASSIEKGLSLIVFGSKMTVFLCLCAGIVKSESPNEILGLTDDRRRVVGIASILYNQGIGPGQIIKYR